MRLLQMSVGWKLRATEDDFQAALAAHQREPKHRSLLFAWLLETIADEITRAVADGTFTMRALAQALHTQEPCRHPQIEMINSWAARPHP